MKYLLDTCIISYLFKAVPEVVDAFKAKSPEELAITTLSVMEIEYGLALNATRAGKFGPKWKEFISIINLLSFETEDAILAASLRAILHKKGQPIGAYDVLIAAVAL